MQLSLKSCGQTDSRTLPSEYLRGIGATPESLMHCPDALVGQSNETNQAVTVIVIIKIRVSKRKEKNRFLKKSSFS